MSDALVHSIYFIGYGVTFTLCGVLAYYAMTVRFKNEGIPISYGFLKVIFSASVVMWLGVGLSFIMYPSVTNAVT
ncbi:MAG: hypothetical protein JKY17_08495 [Magnetovibrio sp.]|nr:hypothetical protein [Magnetovibrio sp.]